MDIDLLESEVESRVTRRLANQGPPKRFRAHPTPYASYMLQRAEWVPPHLCGVAGATQKGQGPSLGR